MRKCVRALFLLAPLLFATAVQAATPVRPPASLPRLQLRQCKPQDISGTWKLIILRETPPGPLTEAYKAAPHQYLYFTAKQTYADVAGAKVFADAADFNVGLRTLNTQDVRQFVLTDKGYLYLYTKGVATDSLQCSFVKRKAYQKRFRRGDIMLRTVIEGKEIYRVYRRAAFDPRSRENVAKAAAAAAAVRAAKQPQKQPKKVQPQQRKQPANAR